MQKRVLGKGLDALIPKRPVEEAHPKEFVQLPLGRIKPAVHQPRQEVEPQELAELSQSIKEKGFIQPIVVRKIAGGDFEVVAGMRRYQAAKLLGLKSIPAAVRDLDDKETFVLAIVENLQRKNLNPLEEAEAFKRLMEEFHFSLEDVARFVSKDKTTIVNSLRLLKLPEEVKQALRKGLISRSQARTILGVERPASQIRLFHEILKQGLSVREIERRTKSTGKRKAKADPFVQEVEQKLQRFLGTKVTIFNRKNNKGKIVVEYYNLDDLERIVRRLG